MKLKHILYIGAGALVIGGCSADETLSDTLRADGTKTPLYIEATLSTGNAAATRAAGKDFNEDDKLLAYIRHVTYNDITVTSGYTSVIADKAPLLAEFTKGSAAMESDGDNKNKTTDLTVSSKPLYWDDFSTNSEADKDLRTANHALQSYYGYCYNGGATGNGTTANGYISTVLDKEKGTLGWTIPNDQASAQKVQHADLLWSAAQQAIVYAHADKNAGVKHGTLEIPYTHAMSEVTVEMKTGEGYEDVAAPFKSTILTLHDMNTVTELTAPTATVTASDTPTNITMYASNYASGNTRSFTAIVAPGTKIATGTKLLDITNVDDNDYTLTVTATMLDDDHWGKDHDTGKGQKGTGFVVTQPGVNYHITITVNKTSIQTKATLKDWVTVNASGTGAIKFPQDEDDPVMDDTNVPAGKQDVKVVTVDKDVFKGGASFSLFTMKADGTNTDSEEKRKNERYDYATVSTFKDNAGEANDEWENTPKIYWPNKTDNYYFRALAQYNGIESSRYNIEKVGNQATADKALNVQQGTVAEGHDILWGTTARHKGTTTNKTYERGQAIPPRTGGVPIAFDHIMSKVTFQLKTTDDDAKVDLTDATIAVSNLFTAGAITIENGHIDPTGTKVETAIAATKAPIEDLLTIPQTIGDNAVITITLKDGTTYKLQLNKCIEDETKDAIREWERGKHYVYTIHLEKEQIKFRALIKDWEQKTGSGTANLEWD